MVNKTKRNKNLPIIKTTLIVLIIVCFGFSIFFINSCSFINTPTERNDIYAKCAKGDTLDFELFKRAERIIKTNKWYFLWLDLYEEKDGLIYAKHLLVCDHNLVLKGATGIIQQIIEARGDTLFGFESEEYFEKINKDLNLYRDDLPKDIVISLKRREKVWNGYGRKFNTILDSVRLIQNTGNVVLYLRKSDTSSFPGRQEYFKDIEFYKREFNSAKTIEIPLSSLYFSRSRRFIYTIEDTNTHFEMQTLYDGILEDLILSIWLDIKKQNSPDL